MNIHQISVFLENRIGQLSEITQLLADNSVDIRALSIAETADYGLARMVVDDSYKASSILLQHGDILSMTPVWAVEVPDSPGGLAKVLSVLADAHVDVEYMYSLFTHKEGKSYIVFRVAETDKFIELLKSHDLTPCTNEELGIQ